MKKRQLNLGQCRTREQAILKIMHWSHCLDRSFTILEIRPSYYGTTEKRKTYFDFTVAYYSGKKEGRYQLQPEPNYEDRNHASGLPYVMNRKFGHYLGNGRRIKLIQNKTCQKSST